MCNALVIHSVTTLVTHNVTTLVTHSVTTLVTHSVTTLVTHNVTTLVTQITFRDTRHNEDVLFSMLTFLPRRRGRHLRTSQAVTNDLHNRDSVTFVRLY